MKERMSTHQAPGAVGSACGQESLPVPGTRGGPAAQEVGPGGGLLEEESEGGSRQGHGEGGQAPSREDVTRIVDPKVAAG